MCTSHPPNILPLPVYLTQIPKLLKSCIRNSFNPKEALLQQRQTAARFFPSTVSPSFLAVAPEITYPVHPPRAKRHSTSQERSGRVGESPPWCSAVCPYRPQSSHGPVWTSSFSSSGSYWKSNDFHISLKGSEIYFALGKKLIVTLAHRQGHKDHTVLQHWTLRAVLSPVAALLLLLLEPHCLTGNGRFHSLRNVPGHLFPFLPLHLQTSGKKGTRWNLNFRAKIALP